MDVYRTTKTFPRDETYALAGQLRRAAVAIPLMIAPSLEYFTPKHGKQLLIEAGELGKTLNGLICAVRPAA